MAYSLDGVPNERCVLSQELEGRWGGYYIERGQKVAFVPLILNQALANSYWLNCSKTHTVRNNGFPK
jgi:hypothetical protein